MEIKKWKEISRRTVFSNSHRKIEKVKFRLPHGEKRDYFIKKENDAVSILALTKNHQVILVKQFRPGPKKILLELPGGGIKKTETPVHAAKRELLEETGYRGNIQFITQRLDCAYTTRVRFVFVATNCLKIKEPIFDKNEPIKVEMMSLKKFREHLKNAQFTDVETGYLALDYLKLI